MTTRRRAVPCVAITAGGVGVLAIATGVGALLVDTSASVADQQIQMGNAPTSVGKDYEDKRVWRDRLVTATWITGSLAIAIGGVAAWMYYADHPVAPRAFTSHRWLAPRGAGAMLFGSF